jgi:hypothetical protein
VAKITRHTQSTKLHQIHQRATQEITGWEVMRLEAAREVYVAEEGSQSLSSERRTVQQGSGKLTTWQGHGNRCMGVLLWRLWDHQYTVSYRGGEWPPWG